MLVALVLGTRPEIIKMSPVIRALEKRSLDHYIIHTGQHYSHEMDRIFFEDLKIKQPEHHLDVGSGLHGQQTAKIMTGTEKILMAHTPDIVLVQGDTNTTLGGALAASKLHISLGHIEAGMRSFDRSMPEEVNRVVTDHISDLCFTPSDRYRQHLLDEGIGPAKIFVTGNTLAQATRQNMEISEPSQYLEKYGLVPKGYMLATLHRQGLVDDRDRLRSAVEGLDLASRQHNMPVLFPCHPRTLKNLKQFGLLDQARSSLELVQPVGYLEFLALENNARLIITDSGGVQEEAYILGVPCVTARETTEWTETVQSGRNMLAGHDPQRMAQCVDKMLDREMAGTGPAQSGTGSADKILDIIEGKNEDETGASA